MEEAQLQLINRLDGISGRAREFMLVYDRVIKGEAALQARDGAAPTEWQACSIISAFINYVAEADRCRYGHFVCDLEPKNNPQRVNDAASTLGRMKMFWRCDDADLSDEQTREREAHVQKFLENESKIIVHLRKKPDMYDPDVDPMDRRDWMMRLRVLGDVEARLINDWERLVDPQETQEAQETEGG